MYFVSIGLNPSRVFTTQANESATDPMAMRLINAFDMRLPNSPFARNPSSGRIGISQRFIESDSSVLHRIDVVDHQRAAVLEHGKNNGQSHGGFGGGNHHHEEAINMSIHLSELIGECHEGQVHRVEHQLDGHKHRDDVAAKDEAGYPEAK